MTHYYRRRRPGRRETLLSAGAAMAVATAIGAVTFYLTRIFVSRERLGPPEALPDRLPDAGDERRELEAAR